MIHQLPQHVADQLEYYVYLLVDPRTGNRKPFYVGKGKGNRAFDHLGKVIPEGGDPRSKYHVIDAIRRENLEPGIVVAAHGLAEDEALRLEAVLIQLLGLRELTNRVEGHKYDETMLDVDDLRIRYEAAISMDEDIKERVLYVSLNGGDEEPYPSIRHEETELRKRTLGDWPVSPRKAARTELVAGVYAQVVRVVFRVAGPDEVTSFVNVSGSSERVRFSHGERIEHPLLRTIVKTSDGDTITKFYQGSIRYGRTAWEEV